MKRTIILRDAEAPVAAERARVVKAVVTVGCALVADGLQWIVPPLWPICDGAMVIALLAIWGWRWEIAAAVVPELIPGLALCPTWTIFAGVIVFGQRKSGTSKRSEPRSVNGPPERERELDQ
jgi:hypothetical protein